MVRVILAGLLIGCGIVVAPIGRALPVESCPPTCDRIPASAWPASSSLPLNTTSHWPPLAGLAVPAIDPRFFFEELCATPTMDDDPRRYAVASTAQALAPPGQWQMRAQVLHWRGDTWWGGELATSVFDQAVAALRNCQIAAPAFSPSVTTFGSDRMASVISGPQIVHQYLVAHPASSTIAELVFWVDPGPGSAPGVPWAPVPDARVLDAMADPLCGAYLSSCG